MNLPSPRSSVVVKGVSEGAILFCTETETYFSLNPVGVQVWRLLPPECSTEAEIVSRLRRDHPEIPAETIESDVRELLAELVKHRLVEVLQAA